MAQVRHQHQTQSAEEAEKEGVTVCISDYHYYQWDHYWIIVENSKYISTCHLESGSS